jgi:uncharacterized protein (DUF2236 family)
VKDPKAGIYGPDSIAWMVDKEAILFLAGGKAALLQLAHPAVAHAVDQHSATRNDPLGRFQRTFDNVFAMVFGDLESAIRHARRVHAIHSRIQGEIRERVGRFESGDRYLANDERALFWVQATLLESAMGIYELCVRPLSATEKERYYAESKRFSMLFGIPDSVIPKNYSAFREYFSAMLASDVISVGAPARKMARFLFVPPRRAARPLFRWLEIVTVGLLTERLREEFGFAFGARERAIFQSSLVAVRRGLPFVPRRLRYVPAYVRARRRLVGKRGPDRVGALIERIAMLPLAPR